MDHPLRFLHGGIKSEGLRGQKPKEGGMDYGDSLKMANGDGRIDSIVRIRYEYNKQEDYFPLMVPRFSSHALILKKKTCLLCFFSAVNVLIHFDSCHNHY